jgi:hypothetical protein
MSAIRFPASLLRRQFVPGVVRLMAVAATFSALMAAGGFGVGRSFAALWSGAAGSLAHAAIR